MDCRFGFFLLLLSTGPGLSLADWTIPTDNDLMCSGQWTWGEFPIKCHFTNISNQFDRYVKWSLVLSVSNGSLAYILGRILIVTAVSWNCKWVLCCLYDMLYILCPCFCLMKSCLQKIILFFIFSFYSIWFT